MLASNIVQRQRETNLCESEIITILILFHQRGYRDFKACYIGYGQRHLDQEFPKLVSYNRFVRPFTRVGIPLYMYLWACMSNGTGISFVDATPLAVCHNRRMVLAGLAARGKTTMGGFFGFKLPLVVNYRMVISAILPRIPYCKHPAMRRFSIAASTTPGSLCAVPC